MAKIYEPKGSLSLRSDHMDYGRATLVSNWHEAREAEPKDHDIQGSKNFNSKNRKLHQSTYDRILNVTDGKLPLSTTHDYMNQIHLHKDFEGRISRHPMINISTFHHTEKPGFSNASERGFGSILPRHPTSHGKRYLDSTYNVDYKDIYPYECEIEDKQQTEEKDYSSLHKKCHSQFTDVADYRRHGRSTWHNESGVYANTELKNDVFKPTDTIPERLL